MTNIIQLSKNILNLYSGTLIRFSQFVNMIKNIYNNIYIVYFKPIYIDIKILKDKYAKFSCGRKCESMIRKKKICRKISLKETACFFFFSYFWIQRKTNEPY